MDKNRMEVSDLEIESNSILGLICRFALTASIAI
jgi:hypothetical protein